MFTKELPTLKLFVNFCYQLNHLSCRAWSTYSSCLLRDHILNKLAVLAFTLLVFLSSILWYLASGSLNEYLKSQIQLQGQHYSKQTTSLALADFSANTGIGVFTEITLANLTGYQSTYALIIDEARLELTFPEPTTPHKGTSAFQKKQDSITTIKQLTINKLTLNSEIKGSVQKEKQNNITQLMTHIKNQLAQDYPAFYPEISARLYAQKKPELNADAYTKSHPDTGPIIEHKQTKNKRGKPQDRIIIQAIIINGFELSIIDKDMKNTIHLSNVQLASIGGKLGIVSNQVGGEILLALLNLAQKQSTDSPK